MSEQVPSKEKMQEQLTGLLYSLHLELDVNRNVPEHVKGRVGRFAMRDWLNNVRNRLHKFEEAFRASNEPPVRQCNHGAISPKGTLFYHGFVGPANHWRCDVCKGVYEGNLTDPSGVALTLVSSSQPPEAASHSADHLTRFTEWLVKEMPAGTVIGDPRWWARKLLAAACVFADEASTPPPGLTYSQACDLLARYAVALQDRQCCGDEMQSAYMTALKACTDAMGVQPPVTKGDGQ